MAGEPGRGAGLEGRLAARGIRQAEQVSGQQLDDLFYSWLYTKESLASGPSGMLTATRGAEPTSFKVVDENTRLLAERKAHR